MKQGIEGRRLAVAVLGATLGGWLGGAAAWAQEPETPFCDEVKTLAQQRQVEFGVAVTDLRWDPAEGGSRPRFSLRSVIYSSTLGEGDQIKGEIEVRVDPDQDGLPGLKKSFPAVTLLPAPKQQTDQGYIYVLEDRLLDFPRTYKLAVPANGRYEVAIRVWLERGGQRLTDLDGSDDCTVVQIPFLASEIQVRSVSYSPSTTPDAHDWRLKLTNLGPLPAWNAALMPTGKLGLDWEVLDAAGKTLPSTSTFPIRPDSHPGLADPGLVEGTDELYRNLKDPDPASKTELAPALVAKPHALAKFVRLQVQHQAETGTQHQAAGELTLDLATGLPVPYEYGVESLTAYAVTTRIFDLVGLVANQGGEPGPEDGVPARWTMVSPEGFETNLDPSEEFPLFPSITPGHGVYATARLDLRDAVLPAGTTAKVRFEVSPKDGNPENDKLELEFPVDPTEPGTGGPQPQADFEIVIKKLEARQSRESCPNDESVTGESPCTRNRLFLDLDLTNRGGDAFSYRLVVARVAPPLLFKRRKTLPKRETPDRVESLKDFRLWQFKPDQDCNGTYQTLQVSVEVTRKVGKKKVKTTYTKERRYRLDPVEIDGKKSCTAVLDE